MTPEVHISVDEVGVGSFAGPVMVCGVVPVYPFPDIRDSKKYSPAQRVALYPHLLSCVSDYALAWADNTAVDDMGIWNVWDLLVTQVVMELRGRCGNLPAVADGRRVPYGLDLCVSRVHGDATDPVIAAASVIAKVTRDAMMREMAFFYPQYGFDIHSGYGTPAHRRAIREFGPSPVHRMTFLRRTLG